MKRVLVLSIGQDTNGNGMRIHQGFERLAPEWQVDLVAIRQSWIQYPEQHGGQPSQRRKLAAKLAAEADVLHLFNGLQGWADFDGRRGTPVLLHHHGTSFRNDHAKIAQGARAIGARQVASTLDLTLLEPDVDWLPAIYSIDELAAIHAEHYQPTERIRIAHAPTNRAVKGTNAVIAAVEQLGERVDFDLIERVPWAECLKRLALADIVVDQLHLGFGSLAVEAWGMGIPVIAGIAPANEATRVEMLRRWGALPFVDASPETLPKVLGRLVRSANARSEAAARGNAHALRYHDERVIVPQLIELYQSLEPTHYPKSTWRGVKPWKKVPA